MSELGVIVAFAGVGLWAFAVLGKAALGLWAVVKRSLRYRGRDLF